MNSTSSLARTVGYLPFGAGARICPFASYVHEETSLVLAAMLCEKRFMKLSGARIRPRLSVNGLLPTNGIRVLAVSSGYHVLNIGTVSRRSSSHRCATLNERAADEPSRDLRRSVLRPVVTSKICDVRTLRLRREMRSCWLYRVYGVASGANSSG